MLKRVSEVKVPPREIRTAIMDAIGRGVPFEEVRAMFPEWIPNKYSYEVVRRDLKHG